MTERWGIVVLAALIVMAALNFWWLPHHATPAMRYWVWLATLALMTAVVLVVGKAITGYFSGVVIDNRNMMSLSKLQMLVWTVVVLSALITGAASNIAGIGADFLPGGPLEIDIPNELLAVMGLAGITMAASPVVLSTKSGAEADPQEVADTRRTLKLEDQQATAYGKVFVKTFRVQASWRDLFLGDEVGNADTPDLGKIQQFLITALLAAVYVATIASAFGEDGAVVALPALSEKFVWLLGVSHGTYLAYKAAPHTKDAKPQGKAPDGQSEAKRQQPTPPAATVKPVVHSESNRRETIMATDGTSPQDGGDIFDQVERQYMPPLLAEIRKDAYERANRNARALIAADVFRAFEDRFGPYSARNKPSIVREHLLLFVAIAMTLAFGVIGLWPYLANNYTGDLGYKPDTFLDIAKLFAGVIVGGVASAGASAVGNRRLPA